MKRKSLFINPKAISENKITHDIINPAMARYKETEKGQGLFLTLNLNEQLATGTFEYTLNHLIDKKLDLRIFDSKYNNDITM